MAKVCDITGKRPQKGNNVSHANNKTRKWFHLNLQTKRFYIPEKDQWVKLRVSTSILRTIHKNGIHAVLKKARKQGTLAKKFWNLTSSN
ncbi:MAG: 50S ribosomal protein L28 [Cytophagales bacterium]|nr:50S ribosomal protein L28 [Cytophagales bacterium]